jgi:hypothetical protein
MVALTDIPKIMRHNNWHNGATLLETWFSRPSAIAPGYGAPVTSVIKMKWVLGYAVARSVYNDLISNRIWVNEPAKQVIENQLRRKGLLVSKKKSFGHLGMNVDQQDKDYINYRAVDSSSLDGLTAALGKFTFRICVAGTVEPRPKKSGGHLVTINEIGVYVRDSFDFNGMQFLGFWNSNTNKVAMLDLTVCDRVWNSDFRQWRTANGKGGDFEIFSDMKRVLRTPPDQFDI